MSEILAARVHALAPEQLSLFVLRLRERVRSRVVPAPPSPSLSGVDVDQLSDGAVEELLAQLLDTVDVNELSDDEVTAMLTTLLPEETE